MFFNKLLKPAVLTIACAAALTAGSFGNVSFFHEAHAQTSQLSGLPDFTKLVEDNGKAVVSISTVKKAKRLGPQNGVPDEQLEMLRRFGFPFPFGDFNGPGMTPERRGQGSGFIIDPNGIILTNNHVVDGADEVTVHLTDKREFKAKVIGTDPKTDIAVIKIEGKNLPVVKLGKSDDVKVGEWVAAFGAPFGLDNTVTAGIVSAKSRNLPDEQFVPFIQTDVAVNPGNSGGALLNMNGEVIGINSNKIGGTAVEGMGYAIPITSASPIIADLMERQTRTKVAEDEVGYIGISLQEVTSQISQMYNMPEGIYVVSVEEGSAAANAGIMKGDIITKFDGSSISSYSDLQKTLQYYAVGDSVTVTVQRPQNGEYVSIELNLTLGSRPASQK